MSIDTWTSEGGSVEVERREANYSPAAGLGNDTTESDRTDDTGTSSEDADEGEVALTPAPGGRGQVVDSKTGKRFRRGVKTAVPADDVERLLSLRRRGQPILVRADS